MATDISNLLRKVDNNGATSDGKLTADEFKTLVQAVQENQGSVKKIVRNTVEYTPDANGVVTMTIHSDSELPAVRLQTTDSRTSIISTDGTVKLHLRYTSIITRSGISEDTGHDGLLLIQRKLASESSWTTAAQISIIPAASDDDSYQEVEIGPYLLDGDQQVRLRVTDTEANVDSAYLTFASIVKTSLAVEFVTNWQNPIPGGEGASTTLTYVLFGAVEKELHLRISGKTSGGASATREIILANSTIQAYTGRNNPYSYNLMDIESEACKIMSVHGVHVIEAWLQAVADPTVQSEHIFSQIFINCDATDTNAYLLLEEVVDTVQNYVTTDILKYAVISPSGADVPLVFSIGNYAGTAEYMHYETTASPGVQYTLHNTVEVTGDSADVISTYLRVTSGGVDMLTPSIGQSIQLITVDNSENFAPTAGPDFELNPKTRNNSEANPARVLNAAQGDREVAASFVNMGWVNDGWFYDSSGQRCFRLLAGQYLNITGYEPYQAYIDAGQRYGNQQASVSIELDFSIRNITNEDDPILRICSYLAADGLPLGLEMKPLEGVFMTRSQRTFGQQNFGWQEGVRTHIVVNMYYNLGAASANETQVSYVRIFVNGIINREFLFDHTRANEFWQSVDGTPTSQGIRIGQDGADIDIYGIRVYQKALSADDILQNYISSMPTAAQKVLFREMNDIMQDGRISYAKAAAKYNVAVWHGEPVSGHNQDTKTDKKGDLFVQLRDSSGAVDMAHSGDLTALTMKGQGTTAKHYYEWNDQWQWKDKTQGSFVDLNGDDHGQKYQLYAGLPWAKKLVGKINYASSMQSHKMGACNLYNDLYRLIVTDWSVMRTAGYENTRVTVPELPVLYFVQTENDTSPVFQGLMTFGPGKADKPTWGYNEDDFPMMAMLEGSDNNFPLTDQRVPWRDEDVTYNPGEEYFEYNGEGNLDFDFGRVDTSTDPNSGAEVETPVPEIVEYYKNAWNFCYRWNPLISYYDGTFEQLKTDRTVNTKLFYWVTRASSGARKFDLFRIEYQGKDASNNDITEWVPAGLTKTGSTWSSLNLMDDTPVSDTSIWESMNEAFIAARVAKWKTGAPTYFSVLSLQLHQAFMKLIAGTDNRSKNTYYVLDPVTFKIHLHADDLDTIFLTNNTGWQMKPYYIEEHDADAAGNTYWEGQYNVLFKLVELAYAESLPQMMNTILSRMATLVGSGQRDRAGNLIPQTPEGCFQKYFFSPAQEYFPAVAYNETARIRYEAAQLAVARNEFTAPDGINPITQSLGDQLEAEKQYIKRRLVYLSSYAAYGEFSASGTDGSLSIRGMKTTDGADAPMVLTIKTHQWLYPTGATGGSLVNPHVRLAPGGRLVDAQGHPYGDEGYQFNIGTIIGDTSCKLSGINYMRSIGNVANLSTNPAYSFTVSGERLVEFIAEPAAGRDAQFRPSSLQVVAPNLRTFSLKGCELIAGECSLADQTRLQSADLRGTGIVGVVLPETETLTEVHLPAKLAEVNVRNTRNLATLTVEGYEYMTAISFTGDSGTFDHLAIIEAAYQAGAAIASLTAENVSWTDVGSSLMDWISSVPTGRITGTISVAGSNTAVTFAMKRRFLQKWGQVDSPTNALYITYAQRDIPAVLIHGDSTIPSAGSYAFDVTPATAGGVSTPYGNKFTAIRWEMDSNAYATVNPQTGQVTATSVGTESADGTGPTAYLRAILTMLDGSSMTATKLVRLYDRSAKVGDYVFADGSYSDIDDGTKTAVGICFWINPENPSERLMVAMEDAAQSIYWGLYSSSSYPANSISGIELESGYEPYDTPMQNVTSSGIVATTEGGSANIVSDATYRDESETGDADGFRKLAAGTAATHIGYMTLPSDFLGWRAGDRIPYGQFESLTVIRHRDEVLGQLGYEIPAASATETERESLTRLIAAIRADGGDQKYAQFYYPAVSYCHAYEPTVIRSGEVLADKFKAGNWFAPSHGDLCRLFWYHSKGYTGATHAIFSNAAQANLFKRFTATGFWTSLEYSAAGAWYVNFSSGGTVSNGKFVSFYVRALAAF